ncbi:MAG: tetraacyldisaccharide 4'-kinase [Maribacter sp.]
MDVLRKLLFPISLVYAFIVFLRNRLYDAGVFTSTSFRTKTICVGNLSVGGTGKTPMIELLVRTLSPKYTVAVLSRGYKRKSTGFVLATPKTSVETLGDEPFQLAAKFPEIVVAVDADRRNGISRIQETLAPNVILLDDAFQHRKVKPGFNILLTAYNHLYIDDWALPTGNLRDLKGEADRANIIVVTKCPEVLSVTEQHNLIKRLKPKVHQKVLFSQISYDRMLKGENTDRLLHELKNEELTLVTGIANPALLIAFLKDEGITFDHLQFNDHHFFTYKEIDNLKQKRCILTTEKDYVRLKDDLSNLYYIEIKHQFMDDGQSILDIELQNFMTTDY